MTGRERIVQRLRALGALVLLIALLGGIPIFLTRAVGWPLPTRVPTLDQLRAALGGSAVDEGTIIKALAIVCWLAWLQIALSAVVEIHAWVKGTASARLPLGGLVQPAVRQLVVSAAVVLATFRTAPTTPVTVTTTPAVASFTTPPATGPAVASPGLADPARTTAATPPRVTITVRPRDSLWRLAERHLGDGMRWRELWDLNRYRTFPDGRTFADPNLIQPGWVLTCPPDAVDADPAPAAAAPVDQAQLAAPAAAEPVENEAPSDPSPAVTTPSPDDVGAPPSAGSPRTPPSTAARDTRDRQGSNDRAPVGLIAGSLTAAGLVVLLDRLRRIQLRRRRPGRVPLLPDEKTVETETKLRLSAVAAHPERVDLALRALAGCLAQLRSGPVPSIDLVSVGPDAIEILLTAKPSVDPGPFELSADGRAWTLPASTALDEIERLAAGQAAPAPALVTLGSIDDREVLVDLETSPRLVVTGDQQVARQLIWSAAIEMSTSPWVDDIELVLVTARDTPLGDLDRVTVLPNVDDVVERVQRSAADTQRDLERAAAPTTLACRVRNPADPWTPTVVFVPEAATDADVQRLLDAIPPNGGVCLLAAATEAPSADRVVQVEAGGATLLPIGLRLSTTHLTEHVVADAEVLLSHALSADFDADVVPDLGAVSPPPSYVPRSALALDGGGVLVSVLGPVEVRGAERAIDRRRSLELVAYLALHPDGVDEGRLRAVLWPEADPSRENFNQTVSRARQPLGHAGDGTLHFPRLTDEQGALYRLGATVASDAALLEDAYRAARRDATDDAMQHLSSMLALIHGLPFEGTKGGWEWTFTEGHSTRLGALAAEAAHLVAQWHIDHGDAQRALWAASQGLRAAPGDEILFRDRMHAHDIAGNLAGVESVMKELRGVVEDGEPYDSIHPDTVAYYEELTRRVSRTG